ncbi:conserved hypothetical protein [Gloeothece citriformis PCC 7424]|uniref:Uncharacterized protein n=1 Tax=Gloeothece citriformis (strain PCC 7424) TaxID=65393 RepID=B7KDS1_GLOC7|nr:hypothetical protein [Gloeothece citriformis]ACK70373.1 conserved hypothetical protein [Gloeothece citriformis PCC 7424]
MIQKLNILKNPQVTYTTDWWAKIVAIIALINFSLVLFNFSYLPLRSSYLKTIPAIVSIYDPVKGIQPHTEINDYLTQVDLLTEYINQQGLEGNATEQLIQNLRQKSLILINDPSFLSFHQLGILAKLKYQIQTHTHTLSANLAFNQFWNREHLAEVGVQQELDFFNRKIRPLLEITYFRAIDNQGNLIDNFGKIDLFFIIFFALEFLRKSILCSRQKPEQPIGKIMLRRWYEGFFFLPFWREFRFIPLMVKLHQSHLVNLEWFLGQLVYEPAAYLSDRISNFLMVRLINQTKTALVTGEITRALLEPKPYIKVNSVDKVDAIVNRFLRLTIYKVLPKLQPDLEALLRYSLKEAVTQSNFYQGLQTVPGIEAFPTEVIEQLADYLATGSVDIITKFYADIKGRELFDDLSQNFKKALEKELKDTINQAELQSLLSDLLEEIKINYVQRSTQDNPEAILDEAEKIRYGASLQSQN